MVSETLQKFDLCQFCEILFGRIENTRGFNEIINLKNIISCCEVFISGDTGPLHYAYALDVNTIGIFLQDNYSTYGYSSEGKNFIVKPGKTEDMIDEVIRICKTFEMISEQ